jgi:hypothetical protein
MEAEHQLGICKALYLWRDNMMPQKTGVSENYNKFVAASLALLTVLAVGSWWRSG